MAQSLFDNRYRYDYIYPRGRSGETLRAIDTEDENRPVVIKRPAPNDAPPIRAGQEVSIVNERRALQRLQGHPVLIELLGSGQFFVGGTPHQYIVLERAEGIIIEEAVLEAKANDNRLSELEMLVIVDQLLDLLQTAHAKDIVYNDVDAKHLFWQRDNYQLKVIDWGNAVLLEGDEVTPQGVSRLSDVYQVGELLYFIITGGRRADVPRDADANFRMDFGDDERRVHSHLQSIISNALHPNTRMRYQSVADLRSELTKYREPIETQRNNIVATVAQKLQRDTLSMSELRTLRTMMEPALAQDPGNPRANEVNNTIVDKLRDISVEADLDATKIYMESHNWGRALELLTELRGGAGQRTGSMIDLMRDICLIMADSDLDFVPEAVDKSIAHLYAEEFAAAAAVLLDNETQDRQRALQWQVAERISSHIPEVLLLRPNLYRLQNSLRQISRDGYEVTEPLDVLGEIDKVLDNLADGSLDLSALRDSYRSVVDHISAINPLLQTFSIQHEFSNRRLPLTSLDRALNAAMALADNMHIIGKQAAASPRIAMQSLDVSRSIDPHNPVWEDLDELLKRLWDRLQTSQIYVPAADGSDLEDWLRTSHAKLEPFQSRLFDNMLVSMVNGVQTALNAWQRYQDVVIYGNREDSVAALGIASTAVNTIAPALSQWFRQLRSVVEGANYVERHALPGGLGRALADGWAQFDRGRLVESERLGQQALENARSESGRFAASRLQDLSKISREWVERNGLESTQRTTEVLENIEGMFTEDEILIREGFESQMPSVETYLKAMSRSLISTYERVSTAAQRLLMVYYVMQGTLEIRDGRIDDGEFWRDAALKALPEYAEKHPVVRTLSEYIERRRELEEAQSVFSQVNGKQILPELDNVRRRLENGEQARLLMPGIQSLRDLSSSLRVWADGDFRAAGLQLDAAVQGINTLEKATEIKLDSYRAWLMDLMEGAAQLAVQSRELRAAIDRKEDQPEPVIGRVFNQQAQVTQSLIGDTYAANLRQWRDTYQRFVDVYTSDTRRSNRLDQLNELFRAMFIDRHPAYPLFRHWYSILESQSEYAAPPTDDPVPRIEEAESFIPDELISSKYAIEPDVAPDEGGNSRGLLIVGVSLIMAVIIAVGGFMLLRGGDSNDIALTITPTIDDVATALAATDAAAVVPLVEETEEVDTDATLIPTAVVEEDFQTPTLAFTATRSEREIALEFTDTPTDTPPTNTPTPTETPTSTNTPTETLTPSITPTSPPSTATPLPAGGLRGQQDLISLLNRTADLPYNPETFTPIQGGYRLGTGTTRDEGDVVRITIPETLLEANYGNNAATRIFTVEASLNLLSYNPVLIDEDGSSVFFGMGLDSARDGNNAAIQIEVPSTSNTAINLLAVSNNSEIFLRQRAVNAVIVRLRIERDLNTGNVSIFVNDELIQSDIEFISPDAPILPVLYVRDSGVLVGVTQWRIRLR